MFFYVSYYRIIVAQEEESFDPNIPTAEFIIIHASIDRLLELFSQGKIRIFLSEVRTLRDIRTKSIYLTHAQKKLTMGIINGIYTRHRDIYKILTPASRAKPVEPNPELLRLQLAQANSDLLDNLKQLTAS